MNEILGLIEFYSGLGLMIGPVIGSGLFYFLGFPGLFFFLALVFLVTTPLIYHWLGPDREYKESASQEEAGLFHYRIIVNSLALGYSMAMIGFLDTAIAPHLATYGIDEVQVGFILAMTDCAYTMSSYVLSKIMKYLPLLWVLAFGLIMSSLAFYLMGPWEVVLPPKLFIVIIGIVCLSMGLGTILVATLPNLVQVAVHDLGRENTDALSDGLGSTSYAGIVSSFMSLGEVIGPLLGGLLVDSFGFNDGAAIMGGSGILLLVLYLYTERSRMR